MSGKKDVIDETCRGYAKKKDPVKCKPPIRNISHPLRYYEFTQDEMKALQECDTESFYQRCIPFSALFATMTYAAIKYGFLKRNPHFGAIPKVMLMAILGHIYGRVSGVPNCDQKLRTTLPPNSYLGKVMKDHYAENNPPPPPKK